MAKNSPREQRGPKTESEHNLSVALRVRPISEDEIVQKATPVVYAVDKKVVVLMDPQDDPDDVLRANRSREKNFAFDVSFDGSASQKEVYEQSAKSLIPSVIQGYNGTVFAYGATGAGKTYTMLGTDEEPGIMARALNDLFLHMNSTSDEMAYRVTMSYLEIYNEMIRDLLNPGAGVLELREDAKGVQVAGLSEVSASSTREVMGILKRGNLERTCEPTAANKTSSRSHAVLQIAIKQRQRVRSVRQEVRMGRLFLIDLAGSERAANTQNKGKRMVEGAHINRSLLALGNCINALCDRNGARYVNFRDSKLTRLLKEALSGNCRTVMIAHVSPASNQFEESRNTLVYADRAKNIKTKARRNVMDVSYHIAQYTNIIAELREEVNRLRVRLDEAKSVSQQPIRGGNPQLDRLKEQLLDVFREQMDLRRNLMDMNNTAMEISLDYTRSNLVIKKWEREKALNMRNKTTLTDTTEEADSTTFLTEAKAREVRGEEIQEPSEVQAAREELKTLQDERMRAEHLRDNIGKELLAAKEKAAKIEEVLPQVVTHGEQQEVLSLLCKVHELEIENMEMQSACLLKNFELRKKELVVLTYEQHRQLCEDLIRQQRAVMEEQQMPVSRELDEMYELFQQESGELALDRNFSLPDIHATSKYGTASTPSRRLAELESVSDLTIHDQPPSRWEREEAQTPARRPRIHVGGEVRGVNSVAAKRRPAAARRTPQHGINRLQEDNNTLFSHSPRAKEIMKEKALARVGGNASTSSLIPPDPQPALPAHFPRQHSIVTLSNSHSTAASPTPADTHSPNIVVPTYSDVEDDVLIKNPEKRKLITTRTRNIAALANAKRRTKQQHDAINTRHQLGLGPPRHEVNRTFVNNADTKPPSDYDNLTQSRLAQHNNSFKAEQPFSDGAESLYRSRALVRVNKPRVSKKHGVHAAGRKPVVRKRQRQDASYQDMTPEMFFKQLAKSTPRGRPHVLASHSPARKSRLPAPTRPMPTQNLQFNFGDEPVEMQASQSVSSSLIHQNAPERGRGLTLHKKVRGPAPKQNMDVVSVSKSSPENSQRSETDRSNKPPPTIPVYGTANIGITGFSLQQ